MMLTRWLSVHSFLLTAHFKYSKFQNFSSEHSLNLLSWEADVGAVVCTVLAEEKKF